MPNRLASNCYRVLSLVLCLFFSSPLLSQNPTAPEADLRAAVVIGILRYTQLQRASESNLLVCAWGNAPSATLLAANSTPIRIHNQPLVVEQLNAYDNINACPVVIVGKGDAQNLPENNNALVICDTCTKANAAAMVTLVSVGDRVVFDVNLANAERAGIRFSSDLLAHARQVEGNL